jgi:hypothetical protein
MVNLNAILEKRVLELETIVAENKADNGGFAKEW